MKSFPVLFFLTAAALISGVVGGPPLQLEPQVGIFPSTYKTFRSLSPGTKARLPLSLAPSHYDLALRPIIDSTGSDQFTAPGRVSITLDIYETVNFITLHSSEITIDESSVQVESQIPNNTNIPVTSITYDTSEETVTFQLGDNLIAGQVYVLTISFTALVGDRLDGLYRSSYLAEDGTTRWIATTQFEDIGARKAFPCFDEPSIKATFKVRLARREAVHHSLFCTEKEGPPEPIGGLPGWVWDSYVKTVTMPTYLLAIIISDFASVSAPSELYRLPIKTWGPPPMTTNASAEFSASAVANILNFFETYLDYPYQLNKMDSVAIPDFAAGAMENWGLNTYRVPYMLWFDGESTVREQWQQASVIAHENSHQWFGNLVTCNWWNDIWLNEGFANYMQFIGAANSGKDFGAMERVILEQVQLAMDFDVTAQSRPVRINETNELVGYPSRIIYEKAGSLIRMMQAFLTEQTFITAIRSYLKQYQYGNAVQDELFAKLTEQGQLDNKLPPGVTIKDIMDTWTLQTGFPLLRVRALSATQIVVSQEKFVLDPSDFDPMALWEIPVAFITKQNPDFSETNLQPKFWINKSSVEVSRPVDTTAEWMLFNPDARNYYRVLYDDLLGPLLLGQLIENNTVISPSSRSQLFDDYFKSAFAGYGTLKDALDFTMYLNDEDHLVVWTTVFNNLRPSYVLLTDTDIFPAFKNYFLSKVSEPLLRVGFTQSPQDSAVTVMLRIQLLDWACSFQDPACLLSAADQVISWMETPDSNPIPTDVQPTVYCAAVAREPAIKPFILEEYKRNRSTRQRELLRNALACDSSANGLISLFNAALNSTSDILRTDAVPLLQKIADNSIGRRLVLDRLQSDSAEIVSSLGASAVSSLVTTISQYTSSASSSEAISVAEVVMFVEQFVQANSDLPQSVIDSLNTSLAKITSNSKWMDDHYQTYREWLEG